MKNKLNYYQILEIKPNATFTEIKEAYRRLVKIYHPDINKKVDANKKIALINEAYKYLSSSYSRANYDYQIFQKKQNSNINNPKNYSSFFDEFEKDDEFYNEMDNFATKTPNLDKEYQKLIEEFDIDDEIFIQKARNSFENYQNGEEDKETFSSYSKKFRFQENAFELNADPKIINQFSIGFKFKWEDVLEILASIKLTKQQIYFRCYFGMHYFDDDKLTARQLIAENFHKSVLVLTRGYLNFVYLYKKEKKALELKAELRFDQSLLQKGFAKMIRYYRLHECSNCFRKNEKFQSEYCKFCLNKRYLKERIAIQISWRAKQKFEPILIFKNYGNRNDKIIGDFILELIPTQSLNKIESLQYKFLINYKIANLNIEELEESSTN